MIDKALSGLIDQGVLGIIVMVLFWAIHMLVKMHNAEKDRMRTDIRRVIDNKEKAFDKEREIFLTQISKLQDRLEGNNEQLVELARKGSG